MTSKWTMESVLETGIRICSSLDLPKNLVDIQDIDIRFIEQITDILTGSIISAHISGSELANGDVVTFGNLLEILEFLVDCLPVENCEDLSLTSDSSSTSDVIERCLEQSNSPRPSEPFHRSHSAFRARVDQLLSDDPETPRNPDMFPTSRITNDKHIVQLKSSDGIYTAVGDEGDLRMIYLRQKLIQCLENPEIFPCSSVNSDVLPQDCFSDNRSVRSAPSIAQSSQQRHHRPTSLIRPTVRPITGRHARRNSSPPWDVSASGRPGPIATEAGDLTVDVLGSLLKAFPRLDLDEHDRRVYRQKAVDLYSSRLHPDNNPTSARSTVTEDLPRNANDHQTLPHNGSRSARTWLEERQQRRLTQLMRHELQASRWRDQQAGQAAERRVHEQARERRRQMVRARNYYRHFVLEFRARKMSKVMQEEQVFRQFFEKLLAQEREKFREIQTLERDERRNRDQLKEQETARLEHCHRTRMAIAYEDWQREREQRVTAIRQEHVELCNRKRELRRLMELNVREMQQNLLTNQDTAYFRSKDGERLLRQHVSRDFVI